MQRDRPMKKLIDRLHIPLYLYLSRKDEDNVRDIGKHGFPSVLLHSMLSNANPFWRLRRSLLRTLGQKNRQLRRLETLTLQSS